MIRIMCAESCMPNADEYRSMSVAQVNFKHYCHYDYDYDYDYYYYHYNYQ